MNVRHDSGRLARWALRLSEFNFHLEGIPGAQNQVADGLSRAPVAAAMRTYQAWAPTSFVVNTIDLSALPHATTLQWESITVEPASTRPELIQKQADDPFCAQILAALHRVDGSGGQARI